MNQMEFMYGFRIGIIPKKKDISSKLREVILREYLKLQIISLAQFLLSMACKKIKDSK